MLLSALRQPVPLPAIFMDTPTPNKRRSIILTVIYFLVTVYIWLRYIFSKDIKQEKVYLFTAILFTCFTVIFFQSIFPKKKLLRIITWIFAIPVTPFLFVHLIFSLRIFTAITLPLWSLATIISISTFLFNQLNYLHLGDDFNKIAIPYLNLTTIATIYAYLDEHLVRLFAKLAPDAGMPQIVKNDGIKIAQYQPFVKLTYFLMILLTAWVTLEKLTGHVYFEQFKNYKDIAFASLGTFVVIDRFVTKVIKK